MSRSSGSPDLGAYLDDVAYPALFARLDGAFPEFDWQHRGARGKSPIPAVPGRADAGEVEAMTPQHAVGYDVTDLDRWSDARSRQSPRRGEPAEEPGS